jgi:hypothetical protein
MRNQGIAQNKIDEQVHKKQMCVLPNRVQYSGEDIHVCYLKELL